MSKFKVATLTSAQIDALPKQAQQDIAGLKKDTKGFTTNYSVLKDADEAFYTRAMELLSKSSPKATTTSVKRNTFGTAKPRTVKKRTTASATKRRKQVAAINGQNRFDKLYLGGTDNAAPKTPTPKAAQTPAAKLKPITSSKSTANHAKARALLLEKHPGAKKVIPKGSCIGVWMTSGGKKIDYAHFLSLAMGGKG